jgi:hypothetical protein
VLLQDKNNAIAKQANRLALRKALSFESKQNEMLAQLAYERRRRGRKKESKWELQTAELY